MICVRKWVEIMTNSEAIAYARIAILNLKENNIEITPDTVLYEMSTLFDLYNEEAIKREAFFRL